MRPKEISEEQEFEARERKIRLEIERILRWETIPDIRKRVKTASPKIQERVKQVFLPELESGGVEANIWLQSIKNDFFYLAENPKDEMGGGKYDDWTPDEIRELYQVLYGEDLDEE